MPDLRQSGDIFAVAVYSKIQSDIFQSDKFPSIMHLIVHVSLFNSHDVCMIIILDLYGFYVNYITFYK